MVSERAAPYTVGLTGGIGSGKSAVGAEFEKLGVTVIDSDAIAHALTAPGGAAIEPIRAAFGASFIGTDGAMDRARMREHVFQAPAERARLEAILHPLIRAGSEARARAAVAAAALSSAAPAYVILMVPLLVEAARRDPQWRARYRRIAVVDCSETTQVHRVMARNGYTEEAVRRIMAAQASRAERLAAADDVIDNEGAPAALAPQVARLHRVYLQLAAG
ncbi:MAG TPA: dephospho-CoA kinase [Burkholderiales bacterium]|jgi:dephospho-CoA kinase|nr:dephospho-CoA kinase [Burkholderiales bacterium]